MYEIPELHETGAHATPRMYGTPAMYKTPGMYKTPVMYEKPVMYETGGGCAAEHLGCVTGLGLGDGGLHDVVARHVGGVDRLLGGGALLVRPPLRSKSLSIDGCHKGPCLTPLAAQLIPLHSLPCPNTPSTKRRTRRHAARLSRQGAPSRLIYPMSQPPQRLAAFGGTHIVGQLPGVN